MMRSMFAAISGLKAHQVMLDVTAADIANVNTVGYKSSRMTFRDSLSQMQRGGAAPGPGQGGSNSAQVGLGSQVGSIDNLMTGGALQTTGNTLDVAISGDGWFRVGTSTAPAVPTALQYTRSGNFTTNDQGYLTTQDGQYVLGRTAPGGAGTDTLIQIAPAAGNLAIGQDGSVSYQPNGGGAARHSGLPVARQVREPGRPRAPGRQHLDRGRERRPRAGQHAGRHLRRHVSRARSRCRTSTSRRSSRT